MALAYIPPNPPKKKKKKKKLSKVYSMPTKLKCPFGSSAFNFLDPSVTTIYIWLLGSLLAIHNKQQPSPNDKGTSIFL
jgi:hypothetical protein